MHRLFTFTLLFLLICLSVMPVHAESENLLVNPSFEYVDVGDHPVGWIGGHNRNTPWITPPDGDFYGFVTGDELMYQDVAYREKGIYTLTFWSATHELAGQYVELQYIDFDGNIVDSSLVFTTHRVDDDGLFGGAYVITLPASQKAYTVRVLVSANGYGWNKVDAMDLQVEVPNGNSADEPTVEQTLHLPIILHP